MLLNMPMNNGFMTVRGQTNNNYALAKRGADLQLRMERTTAVALLLFVALRLCAAFSSAPSFEVTQYFSLAANSTCGGVPPTLFQDQFNGVFANCSIGEHDPQLAVDGDLETWWQSANGDTPVGLVFSLEQVRPAANAKFEAMHK